MSSTSAPLLGEQQSDNTVSSPFCRRACSCPRYRVVNPIRCLGCSLLVVLLLIVLFVAVFTSLGGFKGGDGNDDLPPARLGNGTIRERHTGETFPTKLNENDLTYGALGATAWTDTLPLSLRVPISAVALYVEQSAGRRKLMQFKKRPEENNFDEALEKVLFSHSMRQMLVFKVVRTPASTRRVLNAWVSRFSPYLEQCISMPGKTGEKIFKEEEDAFIEAFQHVRFAKGGEFQLRREGPNKQQGLYLRRLPLFDDANRNKPGTKQEPNGLDYAFYSLRREQGAPEYEPRPRMMDETQEMFEASSTSPQALENKPSEWVRVGKTNCLSRAVFEEKIHYLKNGLTNQLPHLYDDN